MSTEPLPRELDARKAAVRGALVSGSLRPGDMPRFRALLAGDEGSVRAELEFGRDEEGRSLVRVVIDADVEVTCQRCLQPMRRRLESDSTLAIVWTDEQAGQLPRNLEPLVVAEQEVDLWRVVEEELMLALPAFSYHESEACKEILADYSGPAPEEAVPTGKKPNPFDVLAQLKRGKILEE
jgi:uncharacterized protein